MTDDFKQDHTMTLAQGVGIVSDIMAGKPQDRDIREVPVTYRTVGFCTTATVALEEGQASARKRGKNFFNYFTPDQQVLVFNELTKLHQAIEAIMLDLIASEQ